jgi:hypothetical protein
MKQASRLLLSLLLITSSASLRHPLIGFSALELEDHDGRGEWLLGRLREDLAEVIYH